MSLLKEVEDAVGVSEIIEENAKQDGWRLLEEDGYEIENLVGVHILVFGKEVDSKSVIEIAGVIRNRNIEDVREGRGDFVFGPRIFLKGVVREGDEKEERKEGGLYPGYRPEEGSEVLVANLIAITRRGLRQEEIVEKIGISPASRTRILSRKADPGIKIAMETVAAMGAELKELVTSREIDSWLAERLSILETLGTEEMSRILSLPSKRTLIEVGSRLVEERKKRAETREEKFHPLEVLSTSLKWDLREVIEELEAVGFSAKVESPAPKSA